MEMEMGLVRGWVVGRRCGWAREGGECAGGAAVWKNFKVNTCLIQSIKSLKAIKNPSKSDAQSAFLTVVTPSFRPFNLCTSLANMHH